MLKLNLYLLIDEKKLEKIAVRFIKRKIEFMCLDSPDAECIGICKTSQKCRNKEDI